MPDGVVQWFDPRTGQAAVVRGNQVFAADGADVEPVARHPGAHVHFDIRRQGGARRAVAVTLRRSSRAPRRRGAGAVPTGDAGQAADRPPREEAGRLDLAVTTRGDVGRDEVDYATARIGAALRRVEAPLLFARLVVELAPDPARARPALLQVSVDVNGEVVRAHVEGHDVREAADLLEGRLRAKLEHRAERRKARRTRGVAERPPPPRHDDEITLN